MYRRGRAIIGAYGRDRCVAATQDQRLIRLVSGSVEDRVSRATSPQFHPVSECTISRLTDPTNRRKVLTTRPDRRLSLVTFDSFSARACIKWTIASETRARSDVVSSGQRFTRTTLMACRTSSSAALRLLTIHLPSQRQTQLRLIWAFIARPSSSGTLRPWILKPTGCSALDPPHGIHLHQSTARPLPLSGPLDKSSARRHTPGWRRA